jgi:hypothetical protein
MPWLGRFGLAQSNPRQLWIGEHGERNLPPSCHMIPPCEVIADNAEVIIGDMRELRTTRHLADRPNARRRSSSRSFTLM